MEQKQAIGVSHSSRRAVFQNPSTKYELLSLKITKSTRRVKLWWNPLHVCSEWGLASGSQVTNIKMKIIQRRKKDDLDYQKQNHTKRLLARSLNKVKLVRSRRSSTGLAARLGPGSNWQRVLSIIPWDKWVLLIICNSPEWLLHIIKSVLFLSFVNQGLLGRRPVPVCYAKWWILCFFAWHISRAPDTELTSRNVHQLLCTTGMVYRWQKMPRCGSIWWAKTTTHLWAKTTTHLSQHLVPEVK